MVPWQSELTKNDTNLAVVILEGTGHEASHCVIEDGHTVDFYILRSNWKRIQKNIIEIPIYL